MPSTYLSAEQGTLTLRVDALKPAEGFPDGASNFKFPSSEQSHPPPRGPWRLRTRLPVQET